MTSSQSDSSIDDFVAQSRLLNGKSVNEREPWNTEVNSDAIRHFAYGIGDDNPLWLSRSYTKEAGFSGLLAPPAFLASVMYPMLHGAPLDLPLASFIAELEYQWFHWVSEGDEITPSIRQKDVFESEDREGRRSVYIEPPRVFRRPRYVSAGSAAGAG